MVGYTTFPRRNLASRHAPHCAPRHAPRTAHDSVFLRDSVYFEGATLVKERTRDRWHVRCNTVWRSRAWTRFARLRTTPTRATRRRRRTAASSGRRCRWSSSLSCSPLSATRWNAERRRKRPAAQYTERRGLLFFMRSRKCFPNTSKTRPRCAEKRPDLTVAGFLLHIG